MHTIYDITLKCMKKALKCLFSFQYCNDISKYKIAVKGFLDTEERLGLFNFPVYKQE